MEINHVATAAAWDEACRDGHYAPVELARDGFLHCCTPAQLAFVLGRHFAGRTGLVVIAFDPGGVPSPLQWVQSEADQEAFPHLYGPLPCGAVSRVTPVTPRS